MGKKNKKHNRKKAEKSGGKLSNKEYEDELKYLQGEMVKLQYWVKARGLRAIVLFEGRDAAGKGGAIKRITERVSPRVFRVVALPAPSERQKSQIYLQRYMEHFPSAGEVVIFDRSWYNRAGVERVMGFCSDAEYEDFLRDIPEFEHYLIERGIILIKYWFEVSMEEQARRFEQRIEDPRKVWKLSPMDVESYKRWYEYSRARDAMLEASDTKHSPWHLVRSDNKKRARLNCMSHLLSQISYKDVLPDKVKLGIRNMKGKYDDAPLKAHRFIPDRY
ncbi:MAG: polyphosphate kinase 2 [gamma proteobacterium symbiont of Bathyaustriella thionipta]|nr:polyphosphate kinase 2 [gamma proteobacterium symbiont of Bathyaustriella thionipta]